MKRRTLIKTLSGALGAAGIVSALPQSLLAGDSKPKRVLFMGGTGFIGPHMVRALVAAGHQVTLFNRGKSNPHLFPDLEKIKGDRLTDDLRQLAGRDWDVVVDTSCYIPRAVDMLMAALKPDEIGQYVFISTISVYADFSQPGLHEGSELASMAEEPDSEDVNKWYGALKVRCEEQAEKAMPGRVTMVRCGLIIGPGDSTDRFTYWPVTAARSDEMLAPGDGSDPMQTIDARDLADWVAHCIAHRLTGPYNSTNPAGMYTFGDVLGQCRDLLNPDLELTWVPADFLDTQDVQGKGGLPLYAPPGSDWAGVWHTNAEKAAAAGLKARPLADSIRDVHAWWLEQPEERRKLRTGLSAEAQAEVLAAWHASQAG
jgi:2'-hydroxyisoflavone reductase